MFSERFEKLAERLRPRRSRNDIADVLETPSTNNSSSLADATETSHRDMLLETNMVQPLPYFTSRVQRLAQEYVAITGLEDAYVDRFTDYFAQAAQRVPLFLDFLQTRATPDQYAVLQSFVRNGPGYALDEGATQLQGTEGIDFGSSTLSRLIAAELALNVEGLEDPERFGGVVDDLREHFYELPLVALYGRKVFEPVRERFVKNGHVNAIGSDWRGLYHRANRRLSRALTLDGGALRLVSSYDDLDSSPLSSPDSLDFEPLIA